MEKEDNQMRTISRQGFTLIELLIVIAIILILIAIALPNFLEAQLRAKVTKVTAEIRSYGIALEAYHLDFKKYPAAANTRYIEQRWVHLTTPVKYIAGFPIDQFGDDVILSDWNTNPKQYRVFDFIVPLKNTWEGEVFFKQILTTILGRKSEWYIASQGPDRDIDIVMDPYRVKNIREIFYSPTNGTQSNGDILRVGPF